jgi:hypothetical protein
LDVDGFRCCRASSVAGSNPEGLFPVRHLKKHIYAVPPKTVEDLVATLQAAVTTVGVNMLRPV